MTLIFVHIPKTAGTSFYDLIERNYDKNKRFVFNTNKGKNPIPKLLRRQEKNCPEIVYGHGTFGLHEIFPNSEYLTFIRNPVSHTISNYNYIRSSPHNRLHKRVKDMSFSDFVSNLKDMWHDNQHYRQLTNTLFRIEHSEFYNKEIIPDYDQLDWALKKIKFLYRFEDLQEAVSELSREFNWKYGEMPHLNESKKDDFLISEKDIENIRVINHLDFYIYEKVSRKNNDKLTE